MIGVCLAATPDDEILNNWAYVLMAFPVDQVFILGESENHTPFKVLRYAKVIRSLSELPARPVLVTPTGRIPHTSYEYPDDIILVFDADHTHPQHRDSDFAESVSIACANELFSYVAAGIVLSARRAAHG